MMKIHKFKSFKLNILFILLFLSLLIFFPKLKKYIGNQSLNNNQASKFLVIVNKVNESIIFTFDNFLNYFKTKKALISEIDNLKIELNQYTMDKVINSNTVETNLYSDKNKDQFIPASMIFRDFTSIYDTILLDKGSTDGVKIGDFVFIDQDKVIGEISQLSLNNSVATLFSKNQEKVEGIINAIRGKDTLVADNLKILNNPTTSNSDLNNISSSTVSIYKNSSNSENILIDLYGYGGGDFFAEIPANIQVELGSKINFASDEHKLIGEVVNIEKKDASYYQRLLIKGYYNPRVSNNYFILKN